MKAAKTARRRTWAEMDHDDALLLEEIVRRSRVEERGPIAEVLAKKQAEQERQTSSNYRTALLRFHAFLGEDATVGDVNEAAGFRYLEHLRAQGLADNSIATYLKAVKAFTRWMHKHVATISKGEPVGMGACSRVDWALVFKDGGCKRDGAVPTAEDCDGG